MFIAAIAHIYSFPHEPFHINAPQYLNVHGNWYDALLSMLDISDVQEDVSEHLGVVSSSLSRRFRGRTNYYAPRGGYGVGNESQYLITSTNVTYQSGLNTGGDGLNTLSTIKNRYGATEITTTTSAVATVTGLTASSTLTPKFTNIGININKKETKEYSPHFGAAPASTSNYLQNRNSSHSHHHYRHHHHEKQTEGGEGDYDSSLSTKNDTNTSSKSDSNSTYNGISRSMGGNGTGEVEESNRNAIKKSDSSASDWLSTPSDEMIGINVKGIEKDHITINTNPKV